MHVVCETRRLDLRNSSEPKWVLTSQKYIHVYALYILLDQS